MAANNPQARVSIFIDAQNLYHSAKHLHGARVNFAELVQTVAAGRPVIRTLAYVVKSEGVTGSEGEPAGERSFFEALRNAGIELRLKDLQVFAGGAKKADWDVGLAVDAIRTAEIVDTIVIACGDGDHIPLVEYLKNQGRRVEIIAFGRSTSGKLKEACDEFIDLGEEPGKYIIKK